LLDSMMAFRSSVRAKMVNAIDIAGAKCERGDAAGCGRGRYDHDVGAAAFAVSDEIERLGAGILRTVAPLVSGA
jgi:hypothetical protein